MADKKFEHMTTTSDNIAYLNEYGQEGWEMCGIIQSESSFTISGYNTVIYLKREIIKE